MPDFVNLGFEDQGAFPGQAVGWHVRSSISAREVAGWGLVTGGVAAPNPSTFAGYSALNATVADGVAANPYDALSSDAARVTDDATSGLHRIREPAARDLEPGRSYSFGAYLKAGSYSKVGPYASVGAVDVKVTCDLAAGTVDFAGGPPDDTVVAAVSGEVVNLPGGWHRVSLSFRMAEAATPVSFNPGIAFYADTATGGTTYAGSSRTFFIWGFFFHEGELGTAEGFGAGWGNEVWPEFLTVGVDAEAATFPTNTTAPEGREGFEFWDFPYDLVLTTAASASFGAFGYEGFGAGWDNDAWVDELSGDIAADFDPDGEEGFEAEWFNNAWGDELSDFTAVAADFSDDLAEGEESFEGVLPDAVVECNPTTNVFTGAGHPFSNGDRLFLVSAGLLPGGFLKTIPYYAVGTVAGVSFQLSLTSGGAAVDATSAGEGELIARADASRYWDGPSLNPTI